MNKPKATDLIQLLTYLRMEEKWMNNLGQNLPLIREAKGINDLPKHHAAPAVVIGAGPSVKHVDFSLLKDWKGKIFSCDRMFLPLLKAGIKPDYVNTVDGSDKIAEFYSSDKIQNYLKNKNCVTKIILNAQATSPKVSKLIPKNKQYYFTANWDNPLAIISITRLFHRLTKKPMLFTGGNTGSCGWFLAHYLGCNPIGLVGIDFAYDTLNVKETIYYKTFKTLAKGDLKTFLSYYRKVTTWAGKIMLTDQMFLTYYNMIVPHIRKAKAKTYNLGEYSSLPFDIQPMSFQNFVKAFLKLNTKHILGEPIG